MTALSSFHVIGFDRIAACQARSKTFLMLLRTAIAPGRSQLTMAQGVLHMRWLVSLMNQTPRWLVTVTCAATKTVQRQCCTLLQEQSDALEMKDRAIEQAEEAREQLQQEVLSLDAALGGQCKLVQEQAQELINLRRQLEVRVISSCCGVLFAFDIRE